MAMAMVLTQVYLETAQKKALAAHAKRSGRKVSDVMRDAVDAALLGVTTDELKISPATPRNTRVFCGQWPSLSVILEHPDRHP
jgi:hypothetical protein